MVMFMMLLEIIPGKFTSEVQWIQLRWNSKFFIFKCFVLIVIFNSVCKLQKDCLNMNRVSVCE